MINDAALKNILAHSADFSVVAEIYASNAHPPFEPENAIARFANVSNVSFRGVEYTKLVQKFGSINRTIDEKTNTASITLNNLKRIASDFEFQHGFEGLIIVYRLISRHQSIELSDSMILYAGMCDKPKSGKKTSLSVSARYVLAGREVEMPRRKYTPEDAEGRTPDNLLFEGFPFHVQEGVVGYSIRRKKGGIAGWFGLKKSDLQTHTWSSFSDVDANRSVPEVFGRVQMEGLHLGYADVGTQIRMLTAFCEGQIEGFINSRSLDSRFPLDAVSYHESLGELGGVGQQTIDTNWVAPGYYSRTAHLRCQANLTLADETDPAPDVVSIVLGRLLLTPDPLTGLWSVVRWTDNPAAITYFVLTSPDYYNLNANWIHADSFREAYAYNDEILFDTSLSDFLFVPDTAGFAELVESTGNNYLRPTSSVTPDYFKNLRGESEAIDTFAKSAKSFAFDGSEGRPIDPHDIPPDDPTDTGGTTNGLTFYLRRRFTWNVSVTEKIKANDFLHKVGYPVARMFNSQAPNGQIKLNHKKPVDWALGMSGLSGDSISVDDVSPWVNNLAGHLLIAPHTNQSEVRDVTGAAYDEAQNDVILTASDNITVTGFSGADADTPASAVLTVGDPENGDDPSFFILDGIEIEFTAGDDDTEETIAGFIYAAINAHPVLKRKFRAVWSDETVTVYAKFGTLTLDSDLGFSHDAPLANPTAEPVLTATASGSLAAGVIAVAYSYENEHGQTLLSPFQEVTLTANQKITVDAITLPTGADSVVWYVVPAANSQKLRFHSRNNGAGFVINSLPLLTAPLPPDLNRTGTEVLRVSMVFSDRPEVRSNIGRSNVIKGTFEWLLGNREQSYNEIRLKYRDATQDFRLIELRLRDDANIAKIGKVHSLEINGSGIDNYHQAYRIASGLLALYQDAGFFYKWDATREALLLEEGDVVCITDSGSGVCNLPVSIEEISFDNLDKGLPRGNFTARKYSTTLFDDLVAEREIPVVIEGAMLTEGGD